MTRSAVHQALQGAMVFGRIRLPVGYRKRVEHDAGARLHREKFIRHPVEDFRREEQRKHGRLRYICPKHVARHERRFVGYVGGRGALPGQFNESGLYSTPSARAPRLAAAITLRPSPDPKVRLRSRSASPRPYPASSRPVLATPAPRRHLFRADRASVVRLIEEPRVPATQRRSKKNDCDCRPGP